MYRQIKKGETFVLGGCLYTYVRIEGTTIVLQVGTAKRQVVHGLEAFKKTIKQFGLEIVE